MHLKYAIKTEMPEKERTGKKLHILSNYDKIIV
jgi:hypothetical protein